MSAADDLARAASRVLAAFTGYDGNDRPDPATAARRVSALNALYEAVHDVETTTTTQAATGAAADATKGDAA